MRHFIFNLLDGDTERARSLLRAGRWIIDGQERHRDALASGDLALVFVAHTREFVGRAQVITRFLDPMPAGTARPGPATSGVMLAGVEHWTIGVPLHLAVQRIDPNGSNPYVQANAAGFPRGVMQITVKEYETVVSLHDSARDVEAARRPRD